MWVSISVPEDPGWGAVGGGLWMVTLGEGLWVGGLDGDPG